MNKNLPAETNGAKLTPAEQLQAMLAARLPMIKDVLPKHITPDRMLKVMFFSIQKVPKLVRCTPASIMAAMVTCSEYGLEPGPQGHIYLIPRDRNWKDAHGNWHTELNCTVQVGWRGYAELTWRSGALQAPPQAFVICENDQWEYRLGLDPYLDHRPALKDRGDVVAAYAVARLKGADLPVWRFLSRDDLDKRRAVGAKDGDAWTNWEHEMYAKTAMRALCSKDLPISPDKTERLYRVIENEDAAMMHPEIEELNPEEARQAEIRTRARARLEARASEPAPAPATATDPEPEPQEEPPATNGTARRCWVCNGGHLAGDSRVHAKCLKQPGICQRCERGDVRGDLFSPHILTSGREIGICPDCAEIVEQRSAEDGADVVSDEGQE